MTTTTITVGGLTPRHIGDVVAFETTDGGADMAGLTVIAGRLAWLARPAQAATGGPATAVSFEHVAGRYVIDDTAEVTIYDTQEDA